MFRTLPFHVLNTVGFKSCHLTIYSLFDLFFFLFCLSLFWNIETFWSHFSFYSFFSDIFLFILTRPRVNILPLHLKYKNPKCYHFHLFFPIHCAVIFIYLYPCTSVWDLSVSITTTTIIIIAILSSTCYKLHKAVLLFLLWIVSCLLQSQREGKGNLLKCIHMFTISSTLHFFPKVWVAIWFNYPSA